jgi:hypothetical protein
LAASGSQPSIPAPKEHNSAKPKQHLIKPIQFNHLIPKPRVSANRPRKEETCFLSVSPWNASEESVKSPDGAFFAKEDRHKKREDNKGKDHKQEASTQENTTPRRRRTTRTQFYPKESLKRAGTKEKHKKRQRMGIEKEARVKRRKKEAKGGESKEAKERNEGRRKKETKGGERKKRGGLRQTG